MTVTIEAARKAKGKVGSLARLSADVVGVGLTSRNGSYSIKVNLREPAPEPLPDEVDGVPVLYEVVGSLSKRSQ